MVQVAFWEAQASGFVATSFIMLLFLTKKQALLYSTHMMLLVAGSVQPVLPKDELWDHSSTSLIVRMVRLTKIMKKLPFWREKKLSQMNSQEWESLCDGCGKCCLEKLEDLDTGEINYTNIGCELLDVKGCRCMNYEERDRYVPDCVRLNSINIASLKWMPSTCAYKLLSEGKDLPDWHPLISGNPNSVHEAKVSIRGRAIAAAAAGDLEDHIVQWPK